MTMSDESGTVVFARLAGDAAASAAAACGASRAEQQTAYDRAASTAAGDTNDAIHRLGKCAENAGDPEVAHGDADDILCELVKQYVPRGHEIVAVWESVPKWYA